MRLGSAPQAHASHQIERNGFARFAHAGQALRPGILRRKAGIALDDVGVLNVKIPSLGCFASLGIRARRLNSGIIAFVGLRSGRLRQRQRRGEQKTHKYGPSPVLGEGTKCWVPDEEETGHRPAPCERWQVAWSRTPTPTFFGSADSTGGLSLMFLELLIVGGLRTRFVDLLIVREIACV